MEYLRRLVLVYTITRRKNYKLSTLAKLSRWFRYLKEHYTRLFEHITKNVAMTDESWGEGTLNSKAGSVINNGGSMEESIRQIMASCAVLSFYPEAEALRKQKGAERGDGHHTRHILGASSLAAELLLADVARLVAAEGDILPGFVSCKMFGERALSYTCVRPALTGSEGNVLQHTFDALAHALDLPPEQLWTLMG